MSYGDYGFFQRFNTSKNTDFVLAAAAAGQAGVITVKSTGHQLFVQKITVDVVTAAAQAVQIRDSAGTPVVIATIPASQSTPLVIDFGPQGRALTVGKNLDISNTAGPALDFHFEAYEKLGSTPVALGTGTNGVVN